MPSLEPRAMPLNPGKAGHHAGGLPLQGSYCSDRGGSATRWPAEGVVSPENRSGREGPSWRVRERF